MNPAMSILIPSWTGNVDVLMESIQQQTFRDYEIHVIRGISPAARARNLGAQRARADILLFVDDDARLGSESVLQMLYDLVRNDESIAVAGTSKIVSPTATALQQAIARQVPRMTYPIVSQHVETNPPLREYGFSAVTTTCCAVRRSVFQEVGGFDEGLPTGPEDTDFFYRIHARGYRIVLAADCWVYHDPPSNLKTLLRKSFWYGMGHAWEARKSPERSMAVIPLNRWYGKVAVLASILLSPLSFFVHYYFDPVRRIEFGFKPLKTMSTYAVLLGYIYGWRGNRRPLLPARTYMGQKGASTNDSTRTVLYVDAYPKTGGGQQVLLSVASRLTTSRYTPVVALPSTSPFRALLFQAGIRSLGVSFTKDNYTLPSLSRPPSPIFTAFTMARAIYEIIRLARREKIALIHANSAVAGVHSIPAAIILRLPCIVHAHDFQTSGWTNSLLKLLLRYKRSAIVFVSEALAKHYKLGAQPTKVRVIHNGIDISKFRPDESARAAVIQEYGLPVDAFIVGSVGRIEPRKGLAQVVEALASAARLHPRVRLLVVGEAPPDQLEWKAQLMDRIAQLNVADKVIFAGFLDSMPRVVAGLDVLAACATGEGGEAFPLNVLEAMACGRPVISVPQGGVVEQVVDKETGFLVESGDIGAIVDALIALIEDPELARRMGAAGRRVVEQHFRVDQQVRAFEQLYAEMLEESRSGSASNGLVGAARRGLADCYSDGSGYSTGAERRCGRSPAVEV
jgi:glycosyltransferase involved in cell wall biosynthesis